MWGILILLFFYVDLVARDIWRGWLIRSIHSKGASFFFLCMYFHISRGLCYGSFKHNLTWILGNLILIISMAVAFLGYVLPWGQMSFWAATVITKFLSSIPYVGKKLVVWIWGGYSVRGVTLTRFFALHYVFPFVLIVFVLLHKLFLHETGSKTPISKLPKGDKLKFHPYYSWKDVFGFILFFILFKFIVLLFMKLFFDSENFIEANSLVTPIHIQPEWYFLASYAILRSIPKKLGGVLGLLLSVRIFFFFTFYKKQFFYF